MRRVVCCVVLVLFSAPVLAQPLRGTKPIEEKEKHDFAKSMVEGIERYLDRALEQAKKERPQHWKPDYSSKEAYLKSVEPNRQRLARMVGVVDQRVPITELELVGSTAHPSLVAMTDTYRVHAVRWPVLPGLDGEGLLLEPNNKKARATVIALPDADQTPEALVGLSAGLPSHAHFPRFLAEQGCRVIVPVLIDRKDTHSGNPRLKRFTNQTHREFVYRMAYEMGRHVIGYEVQKVLALVDLYAREQGHPPVGVFGYGEGGLIAKFAAALDPRIQSTAVSGHFGPREDLHDEPIYRNVFGLLREFGDGDLLRLILPGRFVAEHSVLDVGPAPAARAGRGGAAPGKIILASAQAVGAEIDAVMRTLPPASKFPRQSVHFRTGAEKEAKGAPAFSKGPGYDLSLRQFLAGLNIDAKVIPQDSAVPKALRQSDPEPRHKRQFDQAVDFTQKQLPLAAERRQQNVWSKLDTKSLEGLQKSQEPLRNQFWEDIIGKLPEPTKPLNPRTRLVYETPKWKGYEVVLDVYDDVIAYGVLLVPKDLKPGEKRPVVVCQHGLEGRPVDVVNPDKKTAYYNSFGAQLADAGFIVFAPQNPYIFENQFRQLVRKGNPLGLTLYSFIVRQHQVILQFLRTLDFVDGARIAYYGLSYGGKVAMRIPAILLDYCLSICSGDFNEWIWKNITLDWQGSYMFTREYEMYEFDLGNTFNYAEMAALIAPRPFMVERGHSDGVGLDEYVAFEYAKVRRFYAQLGIADRTEIEFFTGGHEIHLRGTMAFLRKHLNFPEK